MITWWVLRATGVVSLVLLTAVTVLGIATAERWRLGRLPRFRIVAVHRGLSLAAVAFVAVHVATALLDPYAGVTALSVLLPFSAHWRPLYVGLGTTSLELLAAVVATSLLRRHLSLRVWRAVHLLAYASWLVAVVHSLGAGTDVGSPWFRVLTVVCIAAVTAALLERLAERNPLPKRLVRQGAS
jgi:predicted ferric reductase